MSCDCDYICEKEAVAEQHYSNCNSKRPRSSDGVSLNNEHLQNLEVDYLYHLNLDTSMDLEKQFSDVKFVCLGGKDSRMREFGSYMAKLFNLDLGENLTASGNRYAMYKVGPVLSVSHGIGIPSMTTALQEVIKLLYYAKAKDPIFIRIGSSGGLTIPGGSVVISTSGVSGTLQETYELPVMGNIMSMPSFLDKRLAEELYFLSKDCKDYTIVTGKTMAADDFYRGQARLDGPFCDYTEEAKMAFIRTLAKIGVKNIEMESTAFAAMTTEAGVRAAIVCATFIDRLKTDQVSVGKEVLSEWEERPMLVVANLIKKYLQK